MKKKLLLIVIAMLLVCLEGFSMSKNKEDVVVGTIAYFGNEPFVKLVIKAENDKVYSIKTDDKILKAIKAEFGRRLEFHGTLTPSKNGNGKTAGMDYDGVFEVAYFEILK